MQPYPPQDDDRLGRIVADVQALLHDENAETRTKIERWVALVCRDAAGRRAWWFLKNVASTSLAAGEDLVDLTGAIDKVDAVFCPQRLRRISLAQITELRMDALANGRPNGGPPTHYALEAGRRVHLWPCPAAAVTFATLYQRPFQVEILPDEWEAILLDGVLGRFGRHFDRDALTEDSAEFERRYEAGLMRAAIDTWDVAGFSNWAPRLPAQATQTAGSSTDTATDFVQPASLTGIGHECVYPLVVGP